MDDVAVYDLHVALTDGRALDSATRELDVLTDNGNAAGFDRRNRLVVTGDLFGSDWRGDDSEPAAPGGPCVVRIAPGSGNPAERIAVDADSAFMAVGDDHLLLLGGHPRLLSIASGQVVAEWPDIKTTVPASALQSGEHAWTPFAFDVAGARIAIAHDDQLTVIAFDVPALD